jgi:EAL domain-containing protein (putative c-di-GMP-specific phosphodiesterase class I)
LDEKAPDAEGCRIRHAGVQWRAVLLPESVLDGQTLGRLDRWRKARALFFRADGPEAERAVSQAIGKAWARAQVYGRARRLLIGRDVESLLSHLETSLGPLAEKVRVAPEDPAQTKWDAIGNLTPLPAAGSQVRALWLLDALRSDGLFVEFQPIFDLRSGAALGFEALLRARLPDGSCRPAAEIFPAARALRIEQAFERLSWARALEAAGRLPADAILFLNVNPQLVLASEGQLSVLGAEAERAQFPYTRLALDLIEVEKVESLESLRSALEVAHDLGVAIALDDITSGYGTLRCCLELAPRWIKVDSAITRGIGRDRRRRAVLKMLARVARDFSVALIAEGIESEEDLGVCFQERVFAAQGHFLALPDERPAPASPAFSEWLSARGPVAEETRTGGESAEAEPPVSESGGTAGAGAERAGPGQAEAVAEEPQAISPADSETL